MRILALDPGTSCGWAVSDGPSGTWNLTPARGDSPGMRYIRLRARLEEVRQAHPDLGLVAYEQAFQVGRKAVEIYDGIITHVQSFCAEHHIEHTTVFASTLKKWATGKGNASKQEMRSAWYRRAGEIWTHQGEDEIDALWILAWTIDSIKHRASA